jgi:hypothetical protein
MKWTREETLCLPFVCCSKFYPTATTKMFGFEAADLWLLFAGVCLGVLIEFFSGYWYGKSVYFRLCEWFNPGALESVCSVPGQGIAPMTMHIHSFAQTEECAGKASLPMPVVASVVNPVTEPVTEPVDEPVEESVGGLDHGFEIGDENEGDHVVEEEVDGQW